MATQSRGLGREGCGPPQYRPLVQKRRRPRRGEEGARSCRQEYLGARDRDRRVQGPAVRSRPLRAGRVMAVAEDGRVSRLPPLPDPLPADVQELFSERLKKAGRILNVHHTFGHAPKLSRASAAMAMGLRFETS